MSSVEVSDSELSRSSLGSAAGYPLAPDATHKLVHSRTDESKTVTGQVADVWL